MACGKISATGGERDFDLYDYLINEGGGFSISPLQIEEVPSPSTQAVDTGIDQLAEKSVKKKKMKIY